MIEVSIVILTKDRQEMLAQCLSSLRRNLDPAYETIVVDNASQDGTVEMLKNFKDIILVKNPKNLGVAAGRNLGVQKAKGNFIIFLDDDTFVKESNPFCQMIDFMKANKKVAVVGPKIIYPDGQVQESARLFPTLPALIWRGTFLHKIFPDVSFYHDYVLKNVAHNEIKEVDWVMGACQVIRRNIFDKIGFLDEGYFFGYEDIDFCFRVNKAGFKVIYYPFVEIVHYYQRESAKGMVNRAKLEHLKSILRFFWKRYRTSL